MRADEDVMTAVFAVIAGTPTPQAATLAGMTSADLADAVDVYHTAGRAALRCAAATQDWFQARILFPDWAMAESAVATQFGPRLRHAELDGLIRRWWFIRKAPAWRLRCQPTSAAQLPAMVDAIVATLNDLRSVGAIDDWVSTVYEPEAYVFGGPDGMDVGHELFHADSTGVLSYLRSCDDGEAARAVIGRRELSVLLCTSLFRAAGQEWHEQGDIWHRVSQLRPLRTDESHPGMAELMASIRTLITADVGPTGPLFGPGRPLGTSHEWVGGLQQAGQRLGNLSAAGTLRRGLRDVLAHHVIFMWNRLGIPDRTQDILAHAARDMIMDTWGAAETSKAEPDVVG